MHRSLPIGPVELEIVKHEPDFANDGQGLEESFFGSIDGILSMPELFSAHDYSVEYCKSEGNKMSTTMIVLAFYYFKILTPERRRSVYLNPGVIYIPPTKYDRPDFGDRSLFHAELNRFISDTPPHIELKVSCFGRPEHAMLLVFDVPNQRLEFYDPMADLGGMYFHDGADFYAYLKKHARTLKRENPGLRHIWANVERMQQDAKSCTLWASTTAICRMAGIGRERLPTLNSDILSISNVVRHVLWETCQFKEFGGLWTFTRESVDKAIRECRVPEEFRLTVDKIVACQALNAPRAIPPDIQMSDQYMEPIAFKQSLGVGKPYVPMSEPSLRGFDWKGLIEVELVPNGQMPIYIRDDKAFRRLFMILADHKELRVHTRLLFVNSQDAPMNLIDREPWTRLSSDRILWLDVAEPFEQFDFLCSQLKQVGPVFAELRSGVDRNQIVRCGIENFVLEDLNDAHDPDVLRLLLTSKRVVYKYI